MKKVIVCLLFVLLITSCGGYYKYHAYDIEDVMLRSYTPSHKINTKDRYCLLYENKNATSNTKKFDAISLDQQVSDILKELGVSIKREELIPKATDDEVKKLRENIIHREIENNYKNCDYIIDYRFTTFDIAKGACLHIKTIGINSSEQVGYYSICKTKYSQSQQEEYIRASVLKWWEYQNGANNKKTTTYECSGGGCSTIECTGDSCVIKENPRKK